MEWGSLTCEWVGFAGSFYIIYSNDTCTYILTYHTLILAECSRNTIPCILLYFIKVFLWLFIHIFYCTATAYFMFHFSHFILYFFFHPYLVLMPFFNVSMVKGTVKIASSISTHTHTHHCCYKSIALDMSRRLVRHVAKSICTETMAWF